MRSLWFLGDLQFDLVLKDYFWSKSRFSQTIVLFLDSPSSVRFLLFLADCTWEYFLFHVCVSKMSFIHSFIFLSFIQSTNITLKASWGRINVSSRVGRFHTYSLPLLPYHSHWSSSCQPPAHGCLLDISEPASPTPNFWYLSPHQTLSSSRFSHLQK